MVNSPRSCENLLDRLFLDFQCVAYDRLFDLLCSIETAVSNLFIFYFAVIELLSSDFKRLLLLRMLNSLRVSVVASLWFPIASHFLRISDGFMNSSPANSNVGVFKSSLLSLCSVSRWARWGVVLYFVSDAWHISCDIELLWVCVYLYIFLCSCPLR